MLNSAITYMQIFGIGFSFGIAGPCLFICAPILLTYVVGRRERLGQSLADISLFLVGRVSAYLLLGAVAGISGALLRHFTGPQSAARFINPLTGIISIVLGIAVILHREPKHGSCTGSQGKAYGIGGLFLLGFTLGIAPCAPLAALLLEIALMSKGPFDGAIYALSFGLGTLLSGILVMGALTGMIGGLIRKMVRSEGVISAFRILCALLLVMMGIGMILRSSVSV